MNEQSFNIGLTEEGKLVDSNSLLDGNNVIYLETMYEAYLEDPNSVSEEWRAYFDGLGKTNGTPEFMHSNVRARFKNMGLKSSKVAACASTVDSEKQTRVLQLINSFRFLGHKKALTNPLDEAAIEGIERPEVPELTLAYHQLGESDLSESFNAGSLVTGKEGNTPLRDIFNKLQESYCDVIGSQYMYISSVEEKRWLQERIETRKVSGGYSAEERKNTLKKLIAAETLERYLHTKYVGQKRFSLEGGDSLIPMLNTLIQHAGTNGTREIVLGMAHRGRLNVLINIMGKSPADLFKEFEGSIDNGGRSGDVKYHLGYSSDMSTPGNPVHLAMAFNPSHLEIVGPVVEGAVRARQDRRHQSENTVIPVVIHGDAALAGQGVNMETLNMSETRGYRTHGTIHIVINNQIGFTTSTACDARSTEYCTDLAKMVGAPVFHVNGDRPEAVLDVTKMAVDYRNKFNKDVFIDLVCYRRHGHNEADEPAATQPVMYKKIKALATTQARYAKQLIEDKIITEADVQQYIQDYRSSLDNGTPTVPHLMEKSTLVQEFPVNWSRFKGMSWTTPADTTITPERYQKLGQQLTIVPDDFKVNPRVAAILGRRAKMATGEVPADWGFGENLAYAALVQEGFPVRLSGEDCGRGTFFHRHAVLHEQGDGRDHIPLEHITEDQVSFTVIDSLLSEEAVLAFEYGYATTEADILTIWEAQFGDFANGAQVVIDQFISSAEQKWGLQSGLVMLLPHGYEGMGPEHSSARLERYLQLCAQENMQVCVPTTPAQVFHMLRRQMIRRYRTPLIVMTPKSLLRHPQAVSQMEDFTEAGFQTVIDEIDQIAADKEIERIVFCSGKIYYELLEKRRAEELNNIALVRLEQLYPFPEERVREVLNRYQNAKTHVWCQEEPFNQGAWLNVQPWLVKELRMTGQGTEFEVACRSPMAAPAEGSYKAHAVAQEQVITSALGLA